MESQFSSNPDQYQGVCKHIWGIKVPNKVRSYEARTRHQRCCTRVQRGGTRQLTGDAAARASGRVLPCCATWIPHAFHRRGSDLGRFALNQANSGLNWPKSAVSAWIGHISRNGRFRPKFKKKKRKKEKKEGVERTVWLISKPYFSPVSHKRHNISSSPHISSLTSLVSVLSASLPICFVSLVAVRHSATRHSLSFLLQFILSSALSHAFLTQVSL